MIDFEYLRNIMKTPYCIYRLPIPAQFSTPLKLLRGGGGREGNRTPHYDVQPSLFIYLESEHASPGLPKRERTRTPQPQLRNFTSGQPTLISQSFRETKKKAPGGMVATLRPTEVPVAGHSPPWWSTLGPHGRFQE